MSRRKALSQSHLWQTVRNSKPKNTMPKISTKQLREEVEKLKKEKPKGTKGRAILTKKEKELNHRLAKTGRVNIISSPMGGQPKA
jgi:hypothetical protein